MGDHIIGRVFTQPGSKGDIVTSVLKVCFSIKTGT
jgi:hypothetical protein